MNDPLGSINGADLNRDDHQVVINGIRSAKRPKRVDIIFYNPNKIIAYQPVIKYRAFVEDVEDCDIITTSKIIPDQIKYSASISSKEHYLVLRSDLASRIKFLPSSLAYKSIIHGELQLDHNLVTRQTGLLPALSQRYLLSLSILYLINNRLPYLHIHFLVSNTNKVYVNQSVWTRINIKFIRQSRVRQESSQVSVPRTLLRNYAPFTSQSLPNTHY